MLGTVRTLGYPQPAAYPYAPYAPGYPSYPSFAQGRYAGYAPRVVRAARATRRPRKWGAVELGGQTIRVAIAEGDGALSHASVLESTVFKTGRDPEATLGEVRAWLEARKDGLAGLGVASFGPLDPKVGSPTYGYITTTPKDGWRMCPALQLLDIGVPMAFDTDVNAPAVSELAAAKQQDPGLGSLAYVTVGTGVGVGLVINGEPVHGLLHPEAGHIVVPPYPGDTFGGTPGQRIPQGIEANCAAPALALRAGCELGSLGDLPDDHEVWRAAAHYLACLCVNLILIASPQRIVLGGGVMKRKVLYALIREQVKATLNGYLQVPEVEDDGLARLICEPAHGDVAGLVGALTLAQRAAR